MNASETLKGLVARQTEAFNRNVPEEERVAIYNQIVQAQQTRKAEEGRARSH